MSSSETPWNDFARRVEAAGPLWRSLDFRAVALNVKGAWHNLFTRCFLDSRRSEDIPLLADLPRSERLHCLQQAFPIEDLSSIAANVLDGEIAFDELTIVYRSRRQDESLTDLYWQKDAGFHLSSDILERRRGLLGHVSGSNYSYERFWASGATFHDLVHLAGLDLQSLDNELRILERPVDGLDSLLHTVLRMNGPVSMQHSTLAEFVAPYEAALIPELCTLDGSTLKGVVRAKSRRILDHLVLGLYMQDPERGYSSKTIGLQGERWREIGPDHHECEVEIDEVRSPSATLLLRTDTRCIYRLVVANHSPRGNERSLAYAVFDDEFEAFRIGLEPDGPQRASEFERSVSRLFHFLGFAVDAFGGLGKKLNSVDALVFSDVPPMCLVLECTTGSINSGGKLAT